MTNSASKPQNESGSGLRAVPATAPLHKAKNPPADSLESSGGIVLPAVIAEWEKNSRESIRITLGEYAGKENCDVRIWYTDKQGDLKPSPKGVTVNLDQLPVLADAVSQALATAKARGMLKGGEE